MHHDDKRDFLVLLEGLSHIYKDKLSEIKLEMYWRALKNYALVCQTASKIDQVTAGKNDQATHATKKKN